MPKKEEKKEEILEGFAKNEGKEGFFKLQRSIPPGGKLTFEQAYLTIGKISGTKKDESFVRWLKTNSLAGPEWVFYREEGVPFFSLEHPAEAVETPVVADTAPGKGAGIAMKRKNKKTLDSEITPSAIVEADPAHALELIEKCRDKTILRKAMNIASHLAHKEEHRRHLLRRLEQV